MKIAIICARGGSKRIPNKNIKLLAGQPLISYSIEAVKNANIFDRIIVSTDDQSIADVAEKYGVCVPFLRTSMTDDFIHVHESAIESALQAENYFNEKYDTFFLTCPTSPFVTSELIREAFDTFSTCGKQGLKIFEPNITPSHSARIINGKVSPLFPSEWKKRSQDSEEVYSKMNNAIFIANREAALLENTLELADLYVMKCYDKFVFVDIDTPEDFIFANVLMIGKKICSYF